MLDEIARRRGLRAVAEARAGWREWAQVLPDAERIIREGRGDDDYHRSLYNVMNLHANLAAAVTREGKDDPEVLAAGLALQDEIEAAFNGVQLACDERPTPVQVAAAKTRGLE